MVIKVVNIVVNLIQIDTGLLSNTINEMNEEVTRLKKSITEIYQEILELDAMWDGPANQVFNAQFEKDRQQFISICNELKKYINELGAANNEYNKCENKVAEIVNAIRI